jgi:hypothetical protein
MNEGGEMKTAKKYMKRGSYYEAKRDYWNTWAPHAQARAARYLTATQHREIIRLVKSKEATMVAVAKKYGVNYSTVTKIVYGTRNVRVLRACA